MDVKKESWLLLALAMVQFTHIMDFMVVMPLGDTLMQVFGITPQQFSLVVSSYTFSAGVAGVIAAFFIDRFDRRLLLLFVYSGFMAGTLFCALSPDYETLLMARVITGFFGGIMNGLILSIIGDVIPYARRGKAMGMVMAAFSAAAVAGVPAGFYLGVTFHWSIPFYVIAALGVPVLLAIWYYIPPLLGHLDRAFSAAETRRFLAGIFSSRELLTALAFTCSIILGQFTVIPFIAPYMQRNVGFTEMQIVYIYVAGGALTIFSSPLVGRLADKIGKKKTFNLFALLAVITILVLTNLGKVAAGPAILVTSIFFIVSSGRMIPAQTMITSVVPPVNRGSFMSINTAVQQFSAGLAAVIAGAVIGETEAGSEGPLVNFDHVGYIAAGISLFAILIAYFLREKN